MDMHLENAIAHLPARGRLSQEELSGKGSDYVLFRVRDELSLVGARCEAMAAAACYHKEGYLESVQSGIWAQSDDVKEILERAGELLRAIGADLRANEEARP